MTPSRTTRLLFLATMFVSMAVVLAWAGWIGWRRWPEWRAVREMRAAVEANEAARFLYCVEQVDSLGVAEAVADEIAALRQHPDPRVRMYAVMARTVLRPRGPTEAKELIELFGDPDEHVDVRKCVGYCLAIFSKDADVPALVRGIGKSEDPGYIALYSTDYLGRLPAPNASMRETARFLVRFADNRRHNAPPPGRPWQPEESGTRHTSGEAGK